MKTYYKVISAGNSIQNNYQRGETRVSSRKPEDHEMATGDQVFTLRAENIEAARNADKSAWTRQESMGL